MKKATFFAFALLLANATFAQTWALDKSHAKVGFMVIHLGISEVDGYFKSFDAKITSSKEDFSDAVFEMTADVNTISTNNDMRDGHLKGEGWFDAAKNPTISYKSTGVQKVDDKKYKLTGELTMKGVTKTVYFDLTLIGTTVNQKSKKKMAGFKAIGYLKRSDFGVGGAGGAVSNDVELRASGEFILN